jgi:hypothetical protein
VLLGEHEENDWDGVLERLRCIRNLVKEEPVLDDNWCGLPTKIDKQAGASSRPLWKGRLCTGMSMGWT